MRLFTTKQGVNQYCDKPFDCQLEPWVILIKIIASVASTPGSKCLIAEVMPGLPCSFVTPLSWPLIEFTTAAINKSYYLTLADSHRSQYLLSGAHSKIVAQDQSQLSGVHQKSHPLRSLDDGTWFKLICGASSHDSPSVRNLSEVYTLAGADCIDVAADPAILSAAREGIERAVVRGAHRPLLMASVNDAVDVHFRKAYFDPDLCPKDCPRPCVSVCPAEAIAMTGVINERCYGCGRCIPACPYDFVYAHDHVHGVQHVRDVICMVDALEIHTGPNRCDAFCSLWDQIHDVLPGLQVVSVSFPDLGDDSMLSFALRQMWESMYRAVNAWGIEVIWQTDGRPMSGDIGPGTAKASILLAHRVRDALTSHKIGGHVQLAGGTNWKTIPLMKEAGLLRTDSSAKSTTVSGVAMGGYARKVRFSVHTFTRCLMT